MDVTVSVETTGEVGRLIRIEIPYDLFDERFRTSLKRVASQSRIKGFRPGRAPRALVLKLYGDQINDEVLNELIRAAYENAVREHALKVVGSPKISIDQFEPQHVVKVKAEVDILPEPEISNYFGVEAEIEVDEVVEEDVDRVITEFLKRRSRLDPVSERAIEVGDIVTLDCVGTTTEGRTFFSSDGKGIKFEVGKGEAPTEIEEAVVGMRVGETREVEVRMPEEVSDPSLAGSMAQYRITVTEHVERVLPELTDEFVQSLEVAESVTGFRGDILRRLEEEVRDRNQKNIEAAVFQVIADRNPFEVPKVMIDEEMRRMFFEHGLLDPSREQSYTIDLSPFREQFGWLAEQRVRRRIITGRIITQEGLEVSDEELERWVRERAEHMNVPREKVAEAMAVRKNKEEMRVSLLFRRCTDLVLSRAKIQEKPRSR